MNKNNIIIAVVVVLIVLTAGLWVKKGKETGYSVVYMTSGEVYVGKLSTFPDLELKDGYIFQATKDTTDQTKTNFQLNPIKDSLWEPESMHLIKDNVIFYGALMSDSKIAQTIAGQTK